MVDGFNIYDHKQQLSNGVWVINKGNKEWADEMNHNMEILNDLSNRNMLTIKNGDDILVEFDGTESKTVVLPEQEFIPTNLETLTIKDSNGRILAAYNGTESKDVIITGSTGTSEPYNHNIDKRYTTLYFTEDALNYLGYADFDDAKAIKYRSNVGIVKTVDGDSYNSNDYMAGTFNKMGETYRHVAHDNLKSESNTSNTKNWDTINNFPILNPNLRVNILEKKSVGYIDNLDTYFLGTGFNDVIVNNNLDVKLSSNFVSANKNYVHFQFLLIDSNNTPKNSIEGIGNIEYLNESYIDTFSSFVTKSRSNSYINDLLDNFTDGDSIYVIVYNDNSYSFGDGTIDSQFNNNTDIVYNTLDDIREDIIDKDPNATIVKLYDYESFRDSIDPIYVDVLPVQVPASYEEYTSYAGTTKLFNLYAFGLRVYDNEGFINLSGQSIGNGFIIGPELEYVGVVEGDNECGVTIFTEVYPR